MIDRAAENTIPLWILFLLLSFLSTGQLIETAAKSSEVFCLFVMRTETRVASSCNIYEFTKVKRVKDDTNLLLCWRNVIQNVAKILYKTWFIFLWDENMSVKAKTPTLGYQNIVSTVIVEQLTLQLFLRMKPFSMVTTVYLLKFWSRKCDAWHLSLLCWHINSQPLRGRPSLRWF